MAWQLNSSELIMNSGTAFTGTTTVAPILQGINDVVNANVAANPTTALWQVASFTSSAPAYVVLRRRDGSAGRIIFMAGSSPAAAAIDANESASTTAVYVGYAPASTTDIPSNYTAGVPFSGNYIRALQWQMFNSSSTPQIGYAEASFGITFYIKPTAVTVQLCSIGEIIVTSTGSFLSTVAVTRNNSAAGSFGSAFYLEMAAATSPRMSCLDGSANLIRGIGPVQTTFPASFFTDAMTSDSVGSLRYYYPIVLGALRSGQAVTINGPIGKLRRIAYGPDSLHRVIASQTGGSSQAISIGANINAIGNCYWFTNFDV